MIYSYTQLAQYLACPLRYRYRYLDGWQEKETRAGLLFGRAFEQALAALFRREDPRCALFEAWSQYKNSALEYPKSETWDQMLEQGIHLLTRFVQDDRVQIRNPRRNLQIKFSRPIGNGDEFVAYIDAIGQLDGERSVIDWKTTGARYPDQPAGLLALDPQLVCYSWITGEPNVGFVVFVRKRMVEVQYLRAIITQEQRDRFGAMVASTIQHIEAAQFPARSGIRFPQNGCLSCSHLGLCLGKQDMIDARLIRRPGGDLGWLDETRDPPMPPKLNQRRALFVLAKIDQILAWEREVESQRDTKFVELGRYLCEVRAGQYWRLENLKSFDEFLERRFPESRRKAYYLMSIHEHLPRQIRHELKQLGWSKAAELAKVARREREQFKSADWLHKAQSMPHQRFKEEVEKYLTGESEASELIYFKVYRSQMPVIEQALDTAALMLGSDKSRGYCLEMICADFLAGAHLEDGNPQILLLSMLRFFRFLSTTQKQEFLQQISEAA